MYFPILRGKQFELIALRELASQIPAGFMIPVIDPVRTNTKPLVNTVETLYANGIKPIIIINPNLGEFSNSPTLLLDHFQSHIPDKFTPCIKTKGSTNSSIQLINNMTQPFVIFVEDGLDKALIQAATKADLVFLNPEKTNSQATAMLDKVVLYKNSFNKQVRNADYSERSFFSNLHFEYKQTKNAAGFGDFTILSEEYSESGGPAYVVTIHLSYIDSEAFDDMYVRHFSSFNDDSPTNPGGKFKDALEKLVIFTAENKHLFEETNGLKGLHDLRGKPFPGLGQVKKLSLKHHIETICNYIKE